MTPKEMWRRCLSSAQYIAVAGLQSQEGVEGEKGEKEAGTSGAQDSLKQWGTKVAGFCLGSDY